MIVAMLMGAWILIHQHCCFTDAVSPRSIMVDPLMRRSPLEKNFIRFGRSWPHATSLEPNPVSRLLENTDVKPKTQADSGNWNIGQRDIRGKENFIRFGRAIGPLPGVRTRDVGVNWDSAGPYGNHDGLTLTANDLELLSSKFHSKFRGDDVMSPRKSRSKQNFIRFGRSNAMLNKNKKYSGQSKDNFIRFGRKDSDDDIADSDSLQSTTDDEYVKVRETRDRGKEKGGKSAGFIRFGKSFDYGHFSGDRRDKRSLRSANSEIKCNNSVELCKSCLLETALDPSTLVAPEFSLLPKIPFQHTPIKKNFIRLG